MEFHLLLGPRGSLAVSLYGQLRDAIVSGRLRVGDTLPPRRELARQLHLARNTVANAYDRLIAEGFLVGRVGDGTYVCYEPAGRRQRSPTPTALEPRPLLRDLARGPSEEPPLPYDFRVGVPDTALFPWQTWRRLLARHPAPSAKHAGEADPQGLPVLREAIVHHVGRARSLRASADEVLVTSGAQQALDLIGRVLLEPGNRVGVEDPGYPRARRLFETHGAEVVPVPVDAEGLVVAAIPKGTRLVYVTPSHQFPLGTAMSLGRRMSLLQWAERHQAAIIEDDYDSDFRFDGRPLDPLHSLDRSGRVLYVGTFSKLLAPALRLGFVVAPGSLVRALRETRAVADGYGPLGPQAALAEMLNDGLVLRHTRKAFRIYAERRERLLGALERLAQPHLEPLPAFAGLHLCAVARDRPAGLADLPGRARKLGLKIEPLRPYYQSQALDGVVLGYGAIPANAIEEGVRRLVRALAPADSRRSGRRAP